MPFPAAKPRPVICLSDILPRSKGKVLVIAHRGHWQGAPENSVAAIDAAVAAGAHLVEIDAQATADGHLVVIHDGSLDRTTDGSGLVEALPLEAVRAVHLRERDGGAAAVTGLRIPLLQEALEAARDRIAVNVDVKHDRDLPAVAALVQALDLSEQVLLKTRIKPDGDPLAVQAEAWFAQSTHMPMIAARPGRFSADMQAIAPLNPLIAEIRFTDLDDLTEAGAELDRQDCRIWVNTLDLAHNLDFDDSHALADPDAIWGRLIAAGIGAIQTDRLDELVAYLRGRGLYA